LVKSLLNQVEGELEGVAVDGEESGRSDAGDFVVRLREEVRDVLV
jgi:hypothetical protein